MNNIEGPYKIWDDFPNLRIALIKIAAKRFFFKRLTELHVLVLQFDSLCFESWYAKILAIISSLQATPHIHIIVLDNS